MGMSFGGGANLTALTGTGSTAVVGVRTVGDAFNRIELGPDGFIRLGSGAAPTDQFMGRINSQVLNMGGVPEVSPLGLGYAVKEGANAKQGTAVLAAGTVVVPNTSVTANSRILLTCQALGTVAAPSALCVSARTPGTSFTILASQNTDTSTIAYEIFEPGV